MPSTKTPQPTQAEITEMILATLAELRGGLHADDIIVRNQDQVISLPEDMELEDVVTTLRRVIKSEAEFTNVNRTFRYRPFDGARATALVLKEVFGYVMGKTKRSFFGSEPPQMVSIEVGVGKTEQVPWGQLWLPQEMGEGSYLTLTQANHPEWGRVFRCESMVPKRYSKSIEGLYDQIERKLMADSIYRGKAITASEVPTFIDLSAVDFDDVVYSAEVMEALEAYVWLDLRHPGALRDLNQLIKRLTVLYGTFGVGKTLAAYLTAWLTQNCSEPVGFIYVRPMIDSWRYAVQMAALHGGRWIIFIEDIDTTFDPKNPVELSNILDSMDGLLNKGSQTSMVATTNHIELIPKSMLRLGRTDAIIEIGNLDVAGLTKLTKRVIGDLLAPDVDFDAFFEAAKDFTPSSVREALNRSFRHSMARNGGKATTINTDDLVHAARTLYRQLELMEEAPDRPKREGIDGVLGALIHEQVDAVIEHRVDGAAVYDDEDDYQGRLRTN